MNLAEKVEFIHWPETHYVFIQRTGSIPKNAPLAWQDFHQVLPQLKRDAELTGFLSLYNMDQQVYRAGASVESKPAKLAGNLRYEHFKGGKYARFVLTGPYSDLPAATSRVVQLVAEKKIPRRNDYHIEHYVNDSSTTPEDKLIIEILFPVE